MIRFEIILHIFVFIVLFYCLPTELLPTDIPAFPLPLDPKCVSRLGFSAGQGPKWIDKYMRKWLKMKVLWKTRCFFSRPFFFVGLDMKPDVLVSTR